MGNMSYLRKKSRKLKSGEVQDYYDLVESYWEDGKSKQRVLEYLGTTPFQTIFELESETSVKVAEVLSNMDRPGEEIVRELEALGISVPSGEIKEAKLVFKPPSGGSLYISLESTPVRQESKEKHCPICQVAPNSLQQAKALFRATEKPEHIRNA